MTAPLIDWTTELQSPAARFHAHPWTQTLGPDWLARYTLALALEIPAARVGDVVCAHSTLIVSQHGFFDVRYPTAKVPGSAFVPVFARVADAMPPAKVVDVTPAAAALPGSPIGELRDGRGRIMVEDSGEDVGPSAVVVGTNRVPAAVGRPYYRDQRRWAFAVWRVPVWLLVWVAPRSAGADGTQALELPHASNYSKLGYELYRE